MSFTIEADDWWIFRDHPVEFEEATGAGFFRAYGFAPIDGDTPTAFVDVGFFDCELFAIRLPGIDAPETRGTEGDELERARRAKSRTRALTTGRPILVRGSDEMSFRRGVAKVYVLADAPTLRDYGVFRLGEDETGWAELASVLVGEGLAERVDR